MLTIRAEQMQVFEADRLRVFSHELAKRARQRHGDAVEAWGPDELAELMSREVITARRAGIRERRLLERYADLAVVLGFGFAERIDWAATMLKSKRPPADRLSNLEETAAFAIRGD